MTEAYLSLSLSLFSHALSLFLFLSVCLLSASLCWGVVVSCYVRDKMYRQLSKHTHCTQCIARAFLAKIILGLLVVHGGDQVVL